MTLQSSEAAPSGAPFLIPRVDDQQYRLITLSNGLKALLVSDATADKAAAACDVSAFHIALGCSCYRRAGAAWAVLDGA